MQPVAMNHDTGAWLLLLAKIVLEKDDINIKFGASVVGAEVELDFKFGLWPPITPQ